MNSFIEQISNSDLTPEEIETIRLLFLQRESLGEAIVRIAAAAGIVAPGISPNGPEVLLLASDVENILAYDQELITERKALLERMIELEEVSVDETGKPYWSSCGVYLTGGNVGDDEDE